MGESLVVDAAVSIRLLIGAVFMLAGLYKVRRRRQTEVFIEDLGVPTSMVGAGYFSIVVVEFIAGALFLLGQVALSAPLGAGLFVAFTVVTLRSRDSEQPCACLGRKNATDSIVRRALPRIAGFVGCLGLMMMSETAASSPSMVSATMAALPMAWIVRPRHPVSAPPASSSGENDTTSPIDPEVSRQGSGLMPLQVNDKPLDRRAALTRAGGAAAVGLLAPLNRFGNLLGFDCCYPSCGPNEYCYSSDTGQCACMPTPVKNIAESVYQEPPPSPCDCECRQKQCQEGCPNGQGCLQGCYFNCDPLAEPPLWSAFECSYEVVMYLECIADCADEVDQCHSSCMTSYSWCCGNNPHDCGERSQPFPLDHRSFQALTELEGGLRNGRRRGLWTNRAWVMSSLYRDTVVVSAFLSMAQSPFLKELDRETQLFVKEKLDAGSEKLLANVFALKTVISDDFLQTSIARNADLARSGMKLSADIGASGSQSGSFGVGDVRSRANARKTNRESETRKDDVVRTDDLNWRLESQATKTNEHLMLARVLQVPRTSSVWSFTADWQRDLKRVRQRIRG